MMDRIYSWLCSLWLFLSIALIDARLWLPILGSSEGSSSSGANPYLGEAGALLLLPLLLFSTVLRRRPARILWLLTGLYWILLAAAAAKGLHSGFDLRNILVDGRVALIPLYFLLFAAVGEDYRKQVAAAGLLGLGVFVSIQMALLVAEPTGMLNLNVVPFPVPFFNHALHEVWLFAVALALITMVAKHALKWPLAAALAACIVLSFSRSVWLGIFIATLVSWIVSYFKVPKWSATSMRKLTLGLVLGVAVAWIFNTADGRFLLKFRAHGLCHAVGICEPLPLNYEPGRFVTPGTRAYATGGRLFTSLGNKVDASISDRAVMANLALDAWKQNMWFGSGLGYLYKYQSPGGPKIMNNPHNGYLWVLSKLGLAGALLMLFSLLLGMRNLLKRPPEPLTIWLYFTAVFFVLLEMMQCGIIHVGVMLPLAAAMLLSMPKQGNHGSV